MPQLSFFAFCSRLLDCFKDDLSVGHICGSNFQDGVIRGDGSYYYSALTHVWGWATWQRVWQDYDIKLSASLKIDNSFIAFPAHRVFAKKWEGIFAKVANNEIDTWDYQYAYLNLVKGYRSIIPNFNLVRNIGFGEGGTHTFANHPLAENKLGEIHEIIHPKSKMQDVGADIYTMRKEFGIEPNKKSLISKARKLVKDKF